MISSKAWMCCLSMFLLGAAHAATPDAADPIHNLVELSQRSHVRPFDLTQEPTGDFGNERVVYTDTATGATVWKFTHNPGYNHHAYCNRPIWSRDGKWLALQSKRDTRRGSWLVKADGSSWHFLEDRFSDWSKVKPHTAFFVVGNQIIERDVETGESRIVWDKIGDDGGGLCCPSDDGKKLLHVAGRGSATAPTSIAWLIDVEGNEPAKSFDLQGVTHQVWFTRSPDYAFTMDYELRSDTFKEGQFLCEPAKGGAIRQLDAKHFPHLGFSPDGRYFSTFRQKQLVLYDVSLGKLVPIMDVDRWYHTSWDTDPNSFTVRVGNTINVIWPFDRRYEFVCVPQSHLKYGTFLTEAHPEASPDATKIGYDSSMLGDGDFYVAVSKLPEAPLGVTRSGRTLTWSPPARRQEIAGYCVYLDGKALNRQPLTATQFELPSEGGLAEVTSVEQGGIESARTKSIRPSAPVGGVVKVIDPFTVRLSWQPAPEADVAYYNVYSSTGAVTVDQKRRIASPSGVESIDWGLQAGTAYHYLITAVNRAGDESAPSALLTADTPAIQKIHVAKDVNLTLGKDPSRFEFEVPKDGKYVLWLELTPIDTKLTSTIEVQLDDKKYSERPFWDYVCPGEGDTIKKINLAKLPFWDTLFTSQGVNKIHDLKAGPHSVTVTSGKGSATLSRIDVTNDQGFAPKGITSFLPVTP